MPNKIDGAFQIMYSVPGPIYIGTQSFIEALTGIQEGSFAVGYTATPADGVFGFYDGSAWVWGSGGGGGVESVTGALVDNTDPANPVVNLIVPTTTTLGGVKRNTGSAGQYVTGIDTSGNLEYDTPAGGGVESVTGDGVDNTDPLNPIISYPTPGDIGAEPALGYTPENVANKSTDVDADKTSNTKYPSVKAVYDWALGLFLPYIGWKEVSDTWTYASPSTINIPSDGTTKYKKWMKIRIKQGGAYKYYFASNIASTLITVAVNTSYTVANAPITNIAYSFIDNPYGFPNNFNFTPTGNKFTLGNSTVNAAYTISRGVCKGNIFVKYPAASPTGTITGQIQVSCPVTPSTKLPTYTTVGAASMVDAATALYMCETILNTTLMEIRVINTAGTYAVWAAVSNTVPFTLGVNDSWSMEFSYLLDD